MNLKPNGYTSRKPSRLIRNVRGPPGLDPDLSAPGVIGMQADYLERVFLRIIFSFTPFFVIG